MRVSMEEATECVSPQEAKFLARIRAVVRLGIGAGGKREEPRARAVTWRRHLLWRLVC